MRNATLFTTLALSAVLGAGTLTGRAQIKVPVQVHVTVTIIEKKSGGAFPQDGVTNIISSWQNASSILALKPSDVRGWYHGPLVITGLVDMASPKFLQALTSQEVLDEVRIKIWKPGTDNMYKVVTLYMTHVLKVVKRKAQPAGAAGSPQKRQNDNGELEDVSLTFEKMTIQYYKDDKLSAMDDWASK